MILAMMRIEAPWMIGVFYNCSAFTPQEARFAGDWMSDYYAQNRNDQRCMKHIDPLLSILSLMSFMFMIVVFVV